jgi:uncharacterized repeat protein (TIGR01451 family)
MNHLRGGRLILLAALFVTTLIWAGSASAAVGGPVIIGGDDLTDHGEVDPITGDLIDGWLYLQRALENVSPKVVRANDGSVAALGAEPSDELDGDAGAAIGRAAAKAGLTVDYYEGGAAIDGFFADLASGATKPRIIWIAGTGANNDIDDDDCCDESEALTVNAFAIAEFVNAGGGLVSHGSEYGWLFALLPGLEAIDSGSSDDLNLTPEGVAAFPGVTEQNINAGPWHNHFEGDFGGLQVLVRSLDELDSQTDEDAAVILGGASVSLPSMIVLSPPTAVNLPGTSHTVTATVTDLDGEPLVQTLVTFEITSGPNAGAGAQAVTDDNGQATFTYTSNGLLGTDTIEGCFFFRPDFQESTTETEAGIRRCDVATKTWALAVTPSTPTPPADIGVTKADSPDPVSVGSNLTYTLVVTNHGPGPAPNAQLSDTLPAGVTFLSVSTTLGSCSFAAGTVSCGFGTMSLNQSATVTIVVRVDQAGTIVNTAGVATSVSDPNVANNQIATSVTTAQGPFTPPATPEQPAPSGCSLSTGTPSVFAGVRSVVTVRARFDDGSARAGVAVTVRGAGKAQTVRTNGQGIARFTVLPKRAGRLTVRGAGCGAVLSVAAVMTRSCAALSVTPKSATVGGAAVVTVRIRIAGKPAVGVLVLARGAGLSASGLTNSAGVASLRGTATRPGVVTITVPGVLSCSKRVGVSGAFQPPELTG